eukprot:9498999-Pyramimonas_sp.AAC.2
MTTNGGWASWENGAYGLCVQYPIDYGDGAFMPPDPLVGYEVRAPKHITDYVGRSKGERQLH